MLPFTRCVILQEKKNVIILSLDPYMRMIPPAAVIESLGNEINNNSPPTPRHTMGENNNASLHPAIDRLVDIF